MINKDMEYIETLLCGVANGYLNITMIIHVCTVEAIK